MNLKATEQKEAEFMQPSTKCCKILARFLCIYWQARRQWSPHLALSDLGKIIGQTRNDIANYGLKISNQATLRFWFAVTKVERQSFIKKGRCTMQLVPTDE